MIRISGEERIRKSTINEFEPMGLVGCAFPGKYGIRYIIGTKERIVHYDNRKVYEDMLKILQDKIVTIRIGERYVKVTTLKRYIPNYNEHKLIYSASIARSVTLSGKEELEMIVKFLDDYFNVT